jgi:hypothetical protein
MEREQEREVAVPLATKWRGVRGEANGKKRAL